MRWSVEAPGGMSASTPAPVCGNSTSPEGPNDTSRMNTQAKAASGARSFRKLGDISVMASRGRAVPAARPTEGRAGGTGAGLLSWAAAAQVRAAARSS